MYILSLYVKVGLPVFLRAYLYLLQFIIQPLDGRLKTLKYILMLSTLHLTHSSYFTLHMTLVWRLVCVLKVTVGLTAGLWYMNNIGKDDTLTTYDILTNAKIFSIGQTKIRNDRMCDINSKNRDLFHRIIH